MKFTAFPIDNKDKILTHVEKVAEQLWSHLLFIGNSYYLLTEFEFYIKSKGNTELFDDPYTYGHDNQLTTGKLYLHASGIDITWGNPELHVGILIRGVAKIKDINAIQKAVAEDGNYNIEKVIAGPHNVATELFSNLAIGQSNIIDFVPTIFPKGKHFAFLHTAAAPRHGLVKKEDTFIDLPLRYVGYLPYKVIKHVHQKAISFPGKAQILIEERNKQAIDNTIVKQILDYIPKG